MRFKQFRVLLSTLFILMLISLIFTYLIVIRPVEFFGVKNQSANLTTTQNSGAQIRANYTFEDVFRPTRLILTNNNNKFEMTSQMSILRELNILLSKSFSNTTRLSKLDDISYENLVLREAHSQILFDGLISFGIMNRYFDGLNDDYVNETFSRIVIRTDDSHTAYFVNDENKNIYSAKIDETLNAKMEALYKTDEFYEVESYRGKIKQFFVEQDKVTVEQSAYLIEQIPITFYIRQLFTNQTEIRTRGDGKSVVYNDNLSQLKMDRTTNIITFFENKPGEEILLY